MNEETQQDGSQYVDGVFVAMATLGKEIAALQNEVQRLTDACALADRMWRQQNLFAQGNIEKYAALQQQYEKVCAELDEMQLRLQMVVGETNVSHAWNTAQGMLDRAGITQLWRRGDNLERWFVTSTLTRKVGTGATLLAAIADLDDGTPELPA